MDKDQKAAWLEAQKVVVPEDLVAAAKQQLEFLAAVDRRRWLYDGPLLDRAVYRYKVFWLPMLAKHCEHGAEDDFLYVPLDCEWIWHCHRLNPVQYKKDCEEIFGRILDNHNVISSLQEKSKNKMTEKWSELYPEEPFEFSCDYTVSKETSSEQHGVASRLTYDLISAVKRQSSFCYQVSRPCMQDRRYLEEAAARYKGFLNLIKINHDRSIKQFTVPTYDIDLMWHSHQLHPLSYSNDMINLLGKVLEHDDTDSNRSKGKKLDVGFEKTTKQWEDTYGSRYWKAGAMYRGNSPSPVTSIPYFSSHPVVNETIIDKSLKQSMIVQVLLEIVEIKNLPNNEKSNLYVLFAKKKSDLFFYGGGPLSIQSVSGKKHRASFTCEPTGELTLTLMSRWKPKIATLARMIGTTSISLEDLNNPSSELSTEKWFELKPHSGNVDSKPIYLRVAVSFTVPVLAPFELRMFKSLPVSTNTCLFPLRGKEKFKGWTRFLDHNGEEVIRLQIRNLEKMEGKNVTSLMREVVGIPRESRNPWQLAKYADNNWSLNNYNISLVENITGQDGHIFEIKGDFMMKLFLGKKLEYEPKCCEEQNGNANEFITLVEFSAENPYGKAVALFDMKAGFIEVNETKFVLLGVLLAFILKYANKMQRNNVLLTSKEDAEVTPSSNEVEHVERKTANGIACAEYPGKVVDSVSDKLNALNGQNSGGCGGTCSGVCGGGCGKMSGGCGGCGGGCGNMSARCGGGACGGKCGGGGCGGGCGNMSARCGGGGCGGKCGGGGCGGGCGNMSARCGGGGCGGKCGGGGCGGCGSTATGNMPSAGGGGCGGCGNMVDGSTMTDAVCDGYGGGDFGQYGANHVIPNNNHAEGYAGTAVTV